jgi:hypothetical protein
LCQNASILEQGCTSLSPNSANRKPSLADLTTTTPELKFSVHTAGLSPGSADWNPQFTRDTRRTSSSLRQGLGFRYTQVKRKLDFGAVRSAFDPDSDIGPGAQIGIVTLPRASITAPVRLANGRFVMVYPVVPSMNEAERDSKYLEACDFGKPLRRFRRHQS